MQSEPKFCLLCIFNFVKVNKDTFLKLLKEPSNISAEDLASLEEVMKNFPFCNAATILLAKGNNEKGSMFANQKIKRAALFTPSREVLKRIINTNFTNIIRLPQPISVKNYDNSIENSTVLEYTNIEVEINETNNINSTIDEIYKSIAERNKIVEANPTQLIDSDNGNILFNELIEENNASKIAVDTNIKLDQILKFYVHSKEFGKDIRNANGNLIDEYLEYRVVDTPIVPDLESQSDIISQFIDSDHHMAKPTKHLSTFANIDLAKKSTTEDFELVTENIANILVRQEKYKKAIEVFEKLILKYPNKSTYFAIRIENTKSLIKS